MQETLNKVEIILGNIEGQLLEVTTTEIVRLMNKEDLLAEKEAELATHLEGVELYLASAKEIEEELNDKEREVVQ